jgi:hypothetical protein
VAAKDVISIFQSTTASKRIIIFTRKDDAFSSGLGLTAAYLASPHLVRLFEINGTHPDNELSKMNPDEVAAVVFCRINRPTWLPAGKVFGSGLEVVSMSEKVRR